jgi:uncharacterized protein YdeI (YjbR/CyaY-like superfamily)
MKPRFFKSSAELRDWFDQNHGSEKELLIGFYKKRSDKGGITYPEALEEALCFYSSASTLSVRETRKLVAP